jgi:FkbM family methyltransferase
MLATFDRNSRNNRDRTMPILRSLAKSGIVRLLGKESRPRRILGGLARGYRIDVSPQEKLSYLLGRDEPHLQKAIRQYVSPGDTVYDIGANLGYVSLSLARQVGAKGRVIAFEPIPQNILAFRNNIEINGLKNVELRECAASDRQGEAIIRLAENPSTASLEWHRENPSAVELSIRTVAIDALVQSRELPYPKFVKVDVEGAEASVLLGMHRTLAKARPVLFVECSEIGRERFWRLLIDLGYKCRSAVTRKAVESFENYRHSDFLWVPSSGANSQEVIAKM